MAQNAHGHEIPDPRPMTMPSGFRRPETLAEQVQRLVRQSISRQAAEEGKETFEEANDFDLPDDPPDPSTPFEPFFDPVLGVELTPHDILSMEKGVQTATERRIAALAAQRAAREESAPAATTPAGEPAKAPETQPNPAVEG